MTDYRKLIAEFVGTFTLIFAGVGAVVASGGTNLVAIALAHGLAIAVMGSALGHVSGGVFNPALTVGLWVTRRLAAVDAVAYVVVQLLGGIVAALALVVVFDETQREQVKLGTTLLAAGVSAPEGVLIEALLTFFLMIAVFGTALDSRGPKLGALLIGLTIAMDIAAAGPLTGASMNPARTVGPARQRYGTTTVAWSARFRCDGRAVLYSSSSEKQVWRSSRRLPPVPRGGLQLVTPSSAESPPPHGRCGLGSGPQRPALVLSLNCKTSRARATRHERPRVRATPRRARRALGASELLAEPREGEAGNETDCEVGCRRTTRPSSASRTASRLAEKVVWPR
jgi:MIP family channel proteins